MTARYLFVFFILMLPPIFKHVPWNLSQELHLKQHAGKWRKMTGLMNSFHDPWKSKVDKFKATDHQPA
jgi:hypothetical protein